MRESSFPLAIELEDSWNVTDFIERNAKESPNDIAYRRKTAKRHWANTTWAEFRNEAIAVAKGLIHHGIKPGDTVGIMSRTRYEWTLFDVALWYAGAIGVPVYETSSPDQIAWIGTDAKLKAILVEDDVCEERVHAAEDDIPTLETIWKMSNGALHNLSLAGKDVTDETLMAARAAHGLADVATIIYTSGTTGRPKGCEITHGNLSLLAINSVHQLKTCLVLEDGKTPGSTLLFITLAHVFARFVSVLCMAGKCPMGHTSDMRDVSEDIRSFQPSFLLSVPRVFEKVYNSAEQRAKTDRKGAIFTRAAKTSVAYSRALDTGSVPLSLKVQHRVFDALVYRKLRQAMGGHLRYAVSGSAPLGERLGHFFRGAGITILEGYGLTESTAPTCVNIPGQEDIGTVGTPLPGCAIRIAEDGEILLKGIHIFAGYHNNPDATAKAVVDGWLHTGDIGELTTAGALKITGRKKEIIITAGGKNVVPTVLEDRLRMHPLVSQAIVVGDAKPFIAALITLDAEMLPTWLKAEGLPELTVSEALSNERVQKALDQAVAVANEAVSRAESIRKYHILPVDFSIESAHLTPSLKLKRATIMKDFAEDVENLYNE